MSKCIQVTLSDGRVVLANVEDDVTELPQEDIDALEQWVESVKARRKQNVHIK